MLETGTSAADWASAVESPMQAGSEASAAGSISHAAELTGCPQMPMQQQQQRLTLPGPDGPHVVGVVHRAKMQDVQGVDPDEAAHVQQNASDCLRPDTGNAARCAQQGPRRSAEARHMRLEGNTPATAPLSRVPGEAAGGAVSDRPLAPK